MALNKNKVTITDIVDTINGFNTSFKADVGVINAEVAGIRAKDASLLNGQSSSHYRCNGCSWTCSTSCSGGCRSNCSGGCKQTCTGTCASGCGAGCSGGCSYNCGNTCGGSCSGCSGVNN